MVLDDDDLDEILGDSNGYAYRKAEERSGPPLDYVADKAECSLEQLHLLVRSIERFVPEDLAQPEAAKGSLLSAKKDLLLSPARAAFHYALVSYLALENMLNMANDPDLFGRLVNMSGEEFEAWLHGVASEGSVTG